MEKNEILEKAKAKKAYVGEMEKQKADLGIKLSLIFAGILAVLLICFECAQGHFSGGMALGAVCYCWASAQYFFQFFMAKRPWPVLIGAILHGLAFLACVVFYVLFSLKVIG